MTRSNRQLTQFAVDKLRQAMVYGPDTISKTTQGNTEVEADSCSHCERPAYLVIRLYGKDIMRIIFSPINPRVVAGVLIRTGDFYDSKGRPSRTTRERLNGLLDALGTAKFIPEGVRAFIREDNSCALGKGDACKSFDAGSPAVLLLSHPTDLVFS
jgi:hypothetical protein